MRLAKTAIDNGMQVSSLFTTSSSNCNFTLLIFIFLDRLTNWFEDRRSLLCTGTESYLVTCPFVVAVNYYTMCLFHNFLLLFSLNYFVIGNTN